MTTAKENQELNELHYTHQVHRITRSIAKEGGKMGQRRPKTLFTHVSAHFLHLEKTGELACQIIEVILDLCRLRQPTGATLQVLNES